MEMRTLVEYTFDSTQIPRRTVPCIGIGPRRANISLVIKRSLVALLIALLALPAPQVAAAGQLNARKSPETTGPLEQTSRRCERDVRRAEGEVLARIETCAFFFALDPMSEVHPLRDFGVAWLQMTIDPTTSACVRYIDLEMVLEDGVEIEGVAPDGPIQTRRRPVRHRVELETTGGGTALQPGSVAQSFTLHPHVFFVRDGDQSVRLQYWLDTSYDTIAAVLGAEVSWSILAPVDGFELRLKEILFTC